MIASSALLQVQSLLGGKRGTSAPFNSALARIARRRSLRRAGESRRPPALLIGIANARYAYENASPRSKWLRAPGRGFLTRPRDATQVRPLHPIGS